MIARHFNLFVILTFHPLSVLNCSHNLKNEHMKDKADPKIEVLNDYQHARIRTEMYLSSRDSHTQVIIDYLNNSPIAKEYTWVPAVFTAFREVLDNAIDEVIAHGHGDQIDITFDPLTMTFSVTDNGRGIPIEKDSKTGKHMATLAMSETKAGRNFRERGATRGMNGVGASIVNMCSEFFRLTIHRDGKVFEQEFREGDTNLIIGKPSIRASKKPSGTKVEFKLSPKVFHDLSLDESFISARVFELALSYPKLKVTFQGKKISVRGGPEKTIFGKHKPITIEIKEPGFDCRFWLLPAFFEDGSEYFHGLVNAIPLFNGGVHIETFKRGFTAGLLSALEPMSKRRKLKPIKDDVNSGMLIYSIVEMNSPNFDSQSKTRMINEETKKYVNGALNNPEFYKNVIARNKEWIEAIYARCAARTQRQDLKDLDKLAKASKRLKIEELEDASGRDRMKCTLILAEGKSAISGAASARDSEIFGALPLRGKVLNVLGEPLKKVAENAALGKVASACGLVVGQKANRLNMRYGKLWIACDADADGGNIMSLLVNYFYQMWPELFEPKSPFIYVFQTPFIIAKKGKLRQYWYSDNHAAFKPEDYRGWEITRAKGLAAMNDIDWENAFAKPRLTPIVDTGDLKDCLQLLFGNDADMRKEWLNA